MRRVRALLSAALVVALLSCSKSSTGPGASTTWKFTVGSMPSTMSPSTFTMTLTAAGSGYTGTLPALSYNGVALDSVGSVETLWPKDTTVTYGQVYFLKDTLAGVRRARSSPTCSFALFWGAFNATKDTIFGGFLMYDATGSTTGCSDQGEVIGVKQ